jgi:hypothetical protein
VKSGTTVFLGPTLNLQEARRHLDADYRPPAGRNDVRRALRDGARRIALIDGYLTQVPAVTHKELLEALDLGIEVFGAASMGALRAAELDRYGMVGLGRIYDDYRNGVLRRDDEVAVLHGPAELGYPILSEAMVNIRATVATARVKVIPNAAAEAVIASAQALHYPDRTWPEVLQGARLLGMEAADVDRFRCWLARGRVDQKREDALTLLDLVAAATPRRAGDGGSARPDEPIPR